MKRPSFIYTAVSVTLLILSFYGYPNSIFAQAETPTPTSGSSATPTPDKSGKLSDIKKQIAELEGKIAGLQEQEKSLASQISVMNNQIKLTEYRVASTQNEINELNDDIGVATGKVSNLEKSLDDVTKVLLNRIVSTYEVGSSEPIHLLFSANNISDFFTRANYLRAVQAHDKKLLFETQQAKNDYENQKAIFEDKKRRVEALKVQLEEYTKQLDADKKSKQDLLDVTKNDERRYQQLLSAARSERNAIEGVVSGIQLVNGSPVTKGQAIAVIGNSGAPYCSTGPHLHLEVRVGGGLTNPAGYLRGGVNFSYSYGSDQYGYYGSISPSGSWDWPIDEPIVINQGYGGHGYAQSFYPSGVHTGIDMDSNGSSIIKAPTDGTVYKGSTTCGGAAMNYVALDHGNGVVSWYWHVQ